MIAPRAGLIVPTESGGIADNDVAPLPVDATTTAAAAIAITAGAATANRRRRRRSAPKPRSGRTRTLLGGRPAHRRCRQRGVAVENRELELLQARARVKPELLRQRAPELLVDLERLGLPTGPVQREHQLSARTFAEWVAGG